MSHLKDIEDSVVLESYENAEKGYEGLIDSNAEGIEPKHYFGMLESLCWYKNMLREEVEKRELLK